MKALRRRIRSVIHAIRHESSIPESNSDELSSPVLPRDAYEVDIRAEQMHNIYHIAFLLRQKLISDVVSVILEYADLYSSTTSTIKYDFPYFGTFEPDAPEQLIECEITKAKTRVLRPVRKITFEIKSCAQRSAQDRRTWFTARKSSPEMTLLPGSILDVNGRDELE